ncbi:uncharacterized protein LOC113331221 [Papaver somniferum]|uniref:uncharacterized protein LOC113331221 n=1 Tax=Papaver somniferum TaxID=3469 RepID=UPI000E6F7350|nr:uncharacterized protein LOC113331221 [Papaver somniferum]
MLEFFGISNIDVSDDFGSPLLYASAYGQDDTVELLLNQYKANPNLIFNEVKTPLQASIHCGSWEIVEHLLKAGADPNGGPDGLKALPFAVERGETEIIKLLVDAGADTNATNIVSVGVQSHLLANLAETY